MQEGVYEHCALQELFTGALKELQFNLAGTGGKFAVHLQGSWKAMAVQKMYKAVALSDRLLVK